MRRRWWQILAVGLALMAAQAVAAPPAPLIVAFGDSLTAGLGAPPGASYPDYLRHLIADDGYHYRLLNAGESGDTTTDGLARLPEIERLHPAWVILEFGGNDGLRGLPVSTTRANLQTMIERLRADGAHVLLVGMSLPPNYGPDYIHAFQDVYTGLARQDHLPLLPFIYQDLVPRARHDRSLIQADGIHATARGNQVVAGTVWRYLRPLLQKRGVRGEG